MDQSGMYQSFSKSANIDNLQESIGQVKQETTYTTYNLVEFMKHFNKYHSKLTNAIEDMQAEVDIMRNDNRQIINYIMKDVEEGEVCNQCGEPFI